jgi:hypothetical protein
MGRCRICHQQAGIFKSVHEECERNEDEISRQRDLAKRELEAELRGWFSDGRVSQLPELAAKARRQLEPGEGMTLAASSFSWAINRMVRDKSLLGMDAYGAIAEYLSAFRLGANVPDRGWHHFVMLVALAELAAGKLPQRVDDPGIGFRYEPGESMVWVFGGAQLWQDKVMIDRPTVHTGYSIRVASGMYAHTGTTIPASTFEALVPVAEGNLVVTDRAFWFQGPHSITHIRFAELSYMHCVNNGLVFCTDDASARNQAFMTHEGEGWFMHDLIFGLEALSEGETGKLLPKPGGSNGR